MANEKIWSLYVMYIQSKNILKAGISTDIKARRNKIGNVYGNGKSTDVNILFVQPLCKERSKAESIESAFMARLEEFFKRVEKAGQGSDTERFYADSSIESIEFTYKNRKENTVTVVTCNSRIESYHVDGRTAKRNR